MESYESCVDLGTPIIYIPRQPCCSACGKFASCRVYTPPESSLTDPQKLPVYISTLLTSPFQIVSHDDLCTCPLNLDPRPYWHRFLALFITDREPKRRYENSPTESNVDCVPSRSRRRIRSDREEQGEQVTLTKGGLESEFSGDSAQCSENLEANLLIADLKWEVLREGDEDENHIDVLANTIEEELVQFHATVPKDEPVSLEEASAEDGSKSAVKEDDLSSQGLDLSESQTGHSLLGGQSPQLGLADLSYSEDNYIDLVESKLEAKASVQFQDTDQKVYSEESEAVENLVADSERAAYEEETSFDEFPFNEQTKEALEEQVKAGDHESLQVTSDEEVFISAIESTCKEAVQHVDDNVKSINSEHESLQVENIAASASGLDAASVSEEVEVFDAAIKLQSTESPGNVQQEQLSPALNDKDSTAEAHCGLPDVIQTQDDGGTSKSENAELVAHPAEEESKSGDVEVDQAEEESKSGDVEVDQAEEESKSGDVEVDQALESNSQSDINEPGVDLYYPENRIDNDVKSIINFTEINTDLNQEAPESNVQSTINEPDVYYPENRIIVESSEIENDDQYWPNDQDIVTTNVHEHADGVDGADEPVHLTESSREDVDRVSLKADDLGPEPDSEVAEPSFCEQAELNKTEASEADHALDLSKNQTLSERFEGKSPIRQSLRPSPRQFSLKSDEESVLDELEGIDDPARCDHSPLKRSAKERSGRSPRKRGGVKPDSASKGKSSLSRAENKSQNKVCSTNHVEAPVQASMSRVSSPIAFVPVNCPSTCCSIPSKCRSRTTECAPLCCKSPVCVMPSRRRASSCPKVDRCVICGHLVFSDRPFTKYISKICRRCRLSNNILCDPCTDVCCPPRARCCVSPPPCSPSPRCCVERPTTPLCTPTCSPCTPRRCSAPCCPATCPRLCALDASPPCPCPPLRSCPSPPPCSPLHCISRIPNTCSPNQRLCVAPIGMCCHRGKCLTPSNCLSSCSECVKPCIRAASCQNRYCRSARNSHSTHSLSRFSNSGISVLGGRLVACSMGVTSKTPAGQKYTSKRVNTSRNASTSPDCGIQEPHDVGENRNTEVSRKEGDASKAGTSTCGEQVKEQAKPAKGKGKGAAAQDSKAHKPNKKKKKRRRKGGNKSNNALDGGVYLDPTEQRCENCHVTHSCRLESGCSQSYDQEIGIQYSLYPSMSPYISRPEALTTCLDGIVTYSRGPCVVGMNSCTLAYQSRSICINNNSGGEDFRFFRRFMKVSPVPFSFPETAGDDEGSDSASVLEDAEDGHTAAEEETEGHDQGAAAAMKPAQSKSKLNPRALEDKINLMDEWITSHTSEKSAEEEVPSQDMDAAGEDLSHPEQEQSVKTVKKVKKKKINRDKELSQRLGFTKGGSKSNTALKLTKRQPSLIGRQKTSATTSKAKKATEGVNKSPESTKSGGTKKVKKSLHRATTSTSVGNHKFAMLDAKLTAAINDHVKERDNPLVIKRKTSKTATEVEVENRPEQESELGDKSPEPSPQVEQIEAVSALDYIRVTTSETSVDPEHYNIFFKSSGSPLPVDMARPSVHEEEADEDEPAMGSSVDGNLFMFTNITNNTFADETDDVVPNESTDAPQESSSWKPAEEDAPLVEEPVMFKSGRSLRSMGAMCSFILEGRESSVDGEWMERRSQSFVQESSSNSRPQSGDRESQKLPWFSQLNKSRNMSSEESNGTGPVPVHTSWHSSAAKCGPGKQAGPVSDKHQMGEGKASQKPIFDHLVNPCVSKSPSCTSSRAPRQVMWTKMEDTETVKDIRKAKAMFMKKVQNPCKQSPSGTLRPSSRKCGDESLLRVCQSFSTSTLQHKKSPSSSLYDPVIRADQMDKLLVDFIREFGTPV